MSIIELVNMLAEAIIILAIGLILGRIGRSLSYKVLNEAELNRFTGNIGLEAEKSLSRLVEAVIYVITSVLALKAIGMFKIAAATVLVVLGIIILATIAIEVFELFQNIGLRNKTLPGKNVKTNGLSGKVSKVGLVETIIKTKEGTYAVQNRFIQAGSSH